MEKLKFLLARLRQSSVPEIIYRGRQFLTLWHFLALSYGFLRIALIKMPEQTMNSLCFSSIFIEKKKFQTFYVSDEGALSYENNNQYKPVFFKVKILEIDIRSLWELSRLQNLLAPIISKDNNSYTKVRVNLIDWIKNNPFPCGPNYISAMECGLRIHVFAYCLKYLENISRKERQLIYDSIFKHAWLIERRLSLYSSLGNHTVCEALGLVFAGAIYKNTTGGQRWLSLGISLLRQEITHQVLEDGGPVEQSLNYHRFVLDAYWVAANFIAKNNLGNCSDFTPRLLLGEKFLAAFQCDNGFMPAIGDSDDGHVVAPGFAPVRGVTPDADKGYYQFSEAGYSVFRLDNGSLLTFDHGPLGMEPLYNHGHADALSITLTKKGEPLLVDPGTFRYNGVPEWRRYFKGTRAHNTVTVDGLDQAVQETGFIWSKPYTAKLLKKEESWGQLHLSATHDGYSRLKKPVVHHRSLWHLEGTLFVIQDLFSGHGVHRYELNFHIHPGAEISEVGGWWTISKGGQSVCLALWDDDTFRTVRGQTNPPLGWYSPAYGIKQETGVLQCCKAGAPEEITFLTVICTETPPHPDQLKETICKIRQTA